MTASSWAEVLIGLGSIIVVGIINIAAVAYFYGRMTAKVEALSDLVKKLCGDHTDIALNKAEVSTLKGQIAWGTQQFEALWRAIWALSRGEKVREYDPLDPNYPNRPPR